MKEPVALISSTIAPPELIHYGGLAARYDPATRLEQTRGTIGSLLALGVQEIYLADNSGTNWHEEMAATLQPAKVQVFGHHQYLNKGISELYLLLAALPQLPADRPIIKLSGRYRLTRRLDAELAAADFVVRTWPALRRSRRSVSTVAYAVRNAAIYEQFLRETLRDVFAHPARILGLGSLRRILRTSLFPDSGDFPHHDPPGPIENSSWRALHKLRFTMRTVESLGTQGIAGQGGNEYSQ